MRLSVLDQSPVRAGGRPADAVAETIALAKAAEALGYQRYWLAEHHGTDGLAGCAPEIMIARVASETHHMRIGSGGVMLSHYSPYKVAEMFRLLEVMFPGRIDLGIGRAPGSDQLTAHALAYGSPIGVEYFPTKVADLAAFVQGETPVTEGFARLKATPEPESLPQMWILGSSDQSAQLAAHFGMPFSFAQFINPVGGEQAMAIYRETFKPSEWCAEPEGSIGVFVICAETEAEADRLAKSRDLWRLRLEQGELAPFPSIADAEAYPYSAAERALVARNRERSVIGTPDQVRTRLNALAKQFDVDEIVVLTITYDFAARRESYRLLADAFSLKPPAERSSAA